MLLSYNLLVLYSAVLTDWHKLVSVTRVCAAVHHSIDVLVIIRIELPDQVITSSTTHTTYITWFTSYVY